MFQCSLCRPRAEKIAGQLLVPWQIDCCSREKALLKRSAILMPAFICCRSRRFTQIPRGRSNVAETMNLFPRWLEDGFPLRAFIHQGRCLDIRTPDRYHKSQDLLRDAEQAANSTATGVQQ